MAAVLTRGLTTFSAELDRTFPNREKFTDGWIGDESHSSSTSGHNPDKTGKAEYKDGDSKNEVRAIDRDKDLKSTVTMEQVIQYLVRMGRAGVYLPFRYFIYNGRIWRKANGWQTEVYTGANKHDQHAHFSGDYTEKADEWTGSLGLASLIQKEDDGMATISQEDFDSRMDAWWTKRMSPSAKDNPQRQALRVAPWQQEVGKTGITTHNTLFGPMAADLKKAAGDDTDEAEIARLVLAGLPETQLVDAMTDAQAEKTADLLAARLAARPGA